MRIGLLPHIAIALLLVGDASAQTGLRSASLPDVSPTNPAGAPTIILRSGSLPDRTPQQPIPPTRGDQFLAGPDSYEAPPVSFPFRQRYPFYNPFGYGSSAYATGTPDTRDQRYLMARGYLSLDLQPRTAQVYVDGYYIGTVDDFRRVIPGYPLEPGPHRIEVRAPRHTTTTFDVRIRPNETVTYRTDLDSTEQPVAKAAPVVVPPRAKTFYVIPGCYAGDKPPRNTALPRGCDPSKVRTIPPVVNLAARAQR